jgi:alpha-beta hydrolase superfamily lysophospholipase
VEAIGTGEPGSEGWIRRRRWWLVGGGILLLLVLAIGAALSWHFSSRVLVPDHSSWLEDVEVEAMPPGRIVLARTGDTERPGVYGLDWEGGHAIVGAIVGESAGTVTRRLREVHGYLVPEMEVGVEPNVFAGDPRQAFGVPFTEVGVPGELGRMPAWSIPGRSDTWAIVVHGINSTPQVGLRMVPTLRRAGLPTLLITYREDLGAPPSPDGLHHMGLTEWRDLEAAARYAIGRGARRLVLAGYSMGGALVTQFMQKSPLASRVDGLVLDAPVLDWRETLELNTTEMGFPALAALPLEWAIGARIDADWDSLDALQHSDDDLRLPILLFHGDDDEVVPISTSEDLAAELPRWVTFHSAPEAGHCEAWNVDPRLYERRFTQFLTRVAS